MADVRRRIVEARHRERNGQAGGVVHGAFRMDVFDPSVALGVCLPAWGGLTARQGIELLRALSGLNIVANGLAAHLRCSRSCAPLPCEVTSCRFAGGLYLHDLDLLQFLADGLWQPIEIHS